MNGDAGRRSFPPLSQFFRAPQHFFLSQPRNAEQHDPCAWYGKQQCARLVAKRQCATVIMCLFRGNNQPMRVVRKKAMSPGRYKMNMCFLWWKRSLLALKAPILLVSKLFLSFYLKTLPVYLYFTHSSQATRLSFEAMSLRKMVQKWRPMCVSAHFCANIWHNNIYECSDKAWYSNIPR